MFEANLIVWERFKTGGVAVEVPSLTVNERTNEQTVVLLLGLAVAGDGMPALYGFSPAGVCGLPFLAEHHIRSASTPGVWVCEDDTDLCDGGVSFA